jgi:PAS domain S-box-containing protein
MSQIGEPLVGFYDQRLVVLSVLISILASYVGLDLALRVSAARGLSRRAWWAGGAISMGLGIWSMHFVGMMAFQLPIPVRYDLPTVLISLLAAILASAVALHVVGRERIGRREALVGSVLMGGGIATMHYLGMAAMRLPATCHYDPLLLGLSVVIAVVASLAALTFALSFHEEPKIPMWAKISSSCMMGMAIARMHYVGMASASFTASNIVPDYSRAVDISELGMASIVATTLLVLAFTLWASLETRRRKQTRELTSANEALRSEIAERSVAEEAVRQSEDRLRLLIDSIPALIHSGRPDGYLDYFNQRWLNYVGLSLEDLAGWKWTAVFHPEDVSAVVEKWRAATTTGEPFELEGRVRRADGEYRWMVHRKVPLRDERGNIVKWYGSSVDIEGRKRAEMEARTLINAIPQQIWSGPPDGTIDYCNERWRSETGLVLEELQGDGWQSMLHPDDRERVIKAWHEAVVNGKPYHSEERHRTADGSYRWYLSRGVPLRDAEGRIVRWYGTNTDIEDRKQAEEELRRLSGELLRSQDEERRRIARDLHDTMGQDLVALATMLGQLRSAVPSGERKSRRMLSECKALADGCIRGVRTLSYVLHPQVLDEAGLGGAIHDYVDGFTKRSGIRVDLELSPRVGRMAKDVELALFRVVQEGLTNIQRHSGSQHAKIRVHRNSDLTLEVSDRGRGFSVGKQRRNEEPKFEIGVGIPSMQERVKQIGGRLEIDSNDHGTTVRVTIPLRENERENTSSSNS